MKSNLQIETFITYFIQQLNLEQSDIISSISSMTNWYSDMPSISDDHSWHLRTKAVWCFSASKHPSSGGHFAAAPGGAKLVTTVVVVISGVAAGIAVNGIVIGGIVIISANIADDRSGNVSATIAPNQSSTYISFCLTRDILHSFFVKCRPRSYS